LPIQKPAYTPADDWEYGGEPTDVVSAGGVVVGRDVRGGDGEELDEGPAQDRHDPLFLASLVGDLCSDGVEGLKWPFEPQWIIQTRDLFIDERFGAPAPVVERLGGVLGLWLVTRENHPLGPGPESRLWTSALAVVGMIGDQALDPEIELCLGEGPRGQDAVERVDLVFIQDREPGSSRTPSRDPVEGLAKREVLGSHLPGFDESEHQDALLC